MAEKHRVTFVLIPSSFRAHTALMPSGIRGILTTMFGAHLDSALPSSIISGAVTLRTSALTGPGTMEAISLTTSSKSRPSLNTMLGFVVTPSTRPQSMPCLISSTFAVSRKNFIYYHLWPALGRRRN